MRCLLCTPRSLNKDELCCVQVSDFATAWSLRQAIYDAENRQLFTAPVDKVLFIGPQPSNLHELLAVADNYSVSYT